MFYINKHTKLRSHIALIPINDRQLIKHIMLIGISSAKFVVLGVNVAVSKTYPMLVAALSAGAQTNTFVLVVSMWCFFCGSFCYLC